MTELVGLVIYICNAQVFCFAVIRYCRCVQAIVKRGYRIPQLTLFPSGRSNLKLFSWEQRKFSELYQTNNERNVNGEFRYDRTLSIATMTFNGGNGAADSSLETYKIIRVGDIAFEGHTNKVHAFGRFVLNDAGVEHADSDPLIQRG